MNIDGSGLAAISVGLALTIAGCLATPRPAELGITQRETYVDPAGATAVQADVARVVELRGQSGELAKVSLGTSQGAEPGVAVEFYVFADYSDVVPGATREPSPVGYGLITEADVDFAWVKVQDPEREVVRRGHYVRIAPRQPETPIEKIKGTFKRK
jgi:hypothetical protein